MSMKVGCFLVCLGLNEMLKFWYVFWLDFGYLINLCSVFLYCGILKLLMVYLYLFLSLLGDVIWMLFFFIMNFFVVVFVNVSIIMISSVSYVCFFIMFFWFYWCIVFL